MANYDFKLFIPKTEQQPQKFLYTSPTKSDVKVPVALFTINILNRAVESSLTEEEFEKLFDLCEEADKEDLYGKFISEDEITDFILNENEQKNFLNNLKENHPKLYKIVNSFVENLKGKSDEEKIANNLYLKREDPYLLHGNEQLITYGLEYLNNDNLMSVSKNYKDTCMLYQLYADAKARVDKYEKIINKELAPEDSYCYIELKNKALKDLETIKEKSLDYANHIIQLAKQNNIYIKDYKKALETALENNDIKNIAIYTQRLSDRVFMQFDREELSVNASKRAIELKEPNGQIDTTFVQGYTGDCWFLSSLKSMCSDPKILERINNMITVKKDGNTITSVTVSIQGKYYTIDYENLKAANEYSTGDMDVRALEMALNQYVHENNLLDGDITLGGQGKDAYNLLFGEENIEVSEYTVNGDDFEFDSERYLNTLRTNTENYIISNLTIYGYSSHFDDEDKLFAEDKEGKQVELHFAHAYNYTKIDDKFLYFTDPLAPEKELKIPQERVGKVFDAACTVKFKDNNKQESL